MNNRMVAWMLVSALLGVPSVWADPMGENPGPVESAVTDGVAQDSAAVQVAQAQLVEQARADFLAPRQTLAAPAPRLDDPLYNLNPGPPGPHHPGPPLKDPRPPRKDRPKYTQEQIEIMIREELYGKGEIF